jgi:hypothetical protein
MWNRYRIARAVLTGVLATVGGLVVAPMLATSLGAAGTAEATPRLPADGPAAAVLAWSGYGARAASIGQPPAGVMVQLGIVHTAMHDTVVALGLRDRPFPVGVYARPDPSAPAAIAAAAYTVLIARVPTQRAFLDAAYQEYLARIPDGAAKNRGVELGRRVAVGLLDRRAGEGMDDADPRVLGTSPPTPCR